MTAPPLKREVATCRNKRRHPDDPTARAAAMRAMEQHGEAKRLWVYRCPQCNGWHLTSSNQGVGSLVTADNPVHT